MVADRITASVDQENNLTDERNYDYFKTATTDFVRITMFRCERSCRSLDITNLYREFHIIVLLSGPQRNCFGLPIWFCMERHSTNIAMYSMYNVQ